MVQIWWIWHQRETNGLWDLHSQTWSEQAMKLKHEQTMETNMNVQIQIRSGIELYKSMNVSSFYNLVLENSFIVLIQPFQQYGVLYYSAPHPTTPVCLQSWNIFKDIKKNGWKHVWYFFLYILSSSAQNGLDKNLSVEPEKFYPSDGWIVSGAKFWQS